jgi:hypothetical protein
MKLTDAIQRLEREKEKLGDDSAVSLIGLIEIIFADQPRVIEEHKARERLVWDVIKAKRDAGYPRDAVFFVSVWPEALQALLAARSKP